ncbi:hypothetical protein AXG93_1587s1230 [Marchantia polymorpha subsp. ruderalis]|uniref:Uncharacterized protein n=1 Tax=Marchantia polymorpha subsp. ruderalis TaxID=1480154 RepID=A0A176WRH5_MARPO|nr:hypothetical protein AXG93_1587s1230 [Marchantia polymorpha subsp. ruderalis]
MSASSATTVAAAASLLPTRMSKAMGEWGCAKFVSPACLASANSASPKASTAEGALPPKPHLLADFPPRARSPQAPYLQLFGPKALAPKAHFPAVSPPKDLAPKALEPKADLPPAPFPSFAAPEATAPKALEPKAPAPKASPRTVPEQLSYPLSAHSSVPRVVSLDPKVVLLPPKTSVPSA